MKKRILSLLMCIAMILTVVYNPVLAEKASATCALGIKGNGTNGIYIDINSAPFTTFANYGYEGYTVFKTEALSL